MGRSLARVGLLAAASWACAPQYVEPSAWARFDLAYITSSSADGARQVELSDIAGDDTLSLATAPVDSDTIAWSPAGDEIAYLTEAEVNADGIVPRWGLRGVGVEEDRLLVEIVRGTNRAPPSPSGLVMSWSPSGDQIAAVVPGGSMAFQCNMAGMELWLAELEGEASAAKLIATDVDIVAPTWRADGDALAYTDHYLICGDEGELNSFGWDARVHVVDVGPSNVANVWDFDEWGPVWSPRGDTIAFSAGWRTPPESRSRIDVVDERGATPRALLELPDCALEVGAWFPDGERLLVRSICAAGSAHLIVDVARGTVETELPDLGPVVAIAPDGERVAYVVETGDQPQVAVFDLTESRSETIADGTAPVWRPN